MQTWIVTNGQITHKEGVGNRIKCWVFLDTEPEPGDILELEGNLYRIASAQTRANNRAYTLIMSPHNPPSKWNRLINRLLAVI